MLEHERLHSSDVCVQFVSHDQLVIGKSRMFRFDQVFPPDAPQVNDFPNRHTCTCTCRSQHRGGYACAVCIVLARKGTIIGHEPIELCTTCE